MKKKKKTKIKQIYIVNQIINISLVSKLKKKHFKPMEILLPGKICVVSVSCVCGVCVCVCVCVSVCVCEVCVCVCVCVGMFMWFMRTQICIITLV